MATYAIGDIQGCLTELLLLLELIQFDSEADTLWLTGDLVNRGPNSLEVLRFIKGLGERHPIVLGNNDLHFLAVAYGVRKPNKSDTLEQLLKAPDCHALVDWLRYRHLLHYDPLKSFVMTHAGLAPFWS